MKNYFDFNKSAKEFSSIVNSEENKVWYQIDSKALQLRWTDIEIRNHRMPKFNDEEHKGQENEDENDDSLPPLEEINKSD